MPKRQKKKNVAKQSNNKVTKKSNVVTTKEERKPTEEDLSSMMTRMADEVMRSICNTSKTGGSGGPYWLSKGLYQKEFDEIYDRYVPSTGPPTTGGSKAQLVHVLNKILYEWSNNGWCNARDDFKGLTMASFETDEDDSYDEDLKFPSLSSYAEYLKRLLPVSLTAGQIIGHFVREAKLKEEQEQQYKKQCLEERREAAEDLLCNPENLDELECLQEEEDYGGEKILDEKQLRELKMMIGMLRLNENVALWLEDGTGWYSPNFLSEYKSWEERSHWDGCRYSVSLDNVFDRLSDSIRRLEVDREEEF